MNIFKLIDMFSCLHMVLIHLYFYLMKVKSNNLICMSKKKKLKVEIRRCRTKHAWELDK